MDILKEASLSVRDIYFARDACSLMFISSGAGGWATLAEKLDKFAGVVLSESKDQSYPK
jgi:hypothetical protein